MSVVMRALRAFAYPPRTPRMLDGAGLRPDPELAERTAERQRQARAALGDRWICAAPIARRSAHDGSR